MRLDASGEIMKLGDLRWTDVWPRHAIYQAERADSDAAAQHNRDTRVKTGEWGTGDENVRGIQLVVGKVGHDKSLIDYEPHRVVAESRRARDFLAIDTPSPLQPNRAVIDESSESDWYVEKLCRRAADCIERL